MEGALAFYTSAETAGAGFIALALCIARPLGFVMILPIFTRFNLTAGLIRGALLVALAAPVLPMVLTTVAAVGAVPGMGWTAVNMGKELLIGLVLGMLCGVPFWAVMAAGDLIDLQRGASMANLIEPGAGGEVSVTGTLLFLITVGWLIGTGAFAPALFGPLYDSYALFPVTAPLSLPPDRAVVMLQLLDNVLRAGLVLALPIVVPLLLTEIAIALAGRHIQQINAMFLAMSVKQAVFLLLMLAYAQILVGYALQNIAAPDLRAIFR